MNAKSKYRMYRHRFLRTVRKDFFELLVCLLLASLFVLLSSGAAFAQGNVGINNPAPHAKSLLDLTSTDKGLLTPRMTAVQRLAMFPAADASGRGMLVYQTDGAQGFYYYDGAVWSMLQSGGAGWGLIGNTGTSPATDFLGTADNQPLVLRTNNAEAMRITAGGDVGIGTAAPLHGLHVIRNTANATLGLRNLNDNAVSGVNYYGSAGTLGAVTGWSNNGNAIAPGTLLHGTITNMPVSFITNSLERMRVDQNGNVGIGTTAPTARFEIAHNGTVPMRVRNTNAAGWSVTQYLNSGGQIGHIGWGNPTASNLAGLFFAGTQANAPFIFTTADQERMRLSADGRLGLGTNAPLWKLDVHDVQSVGRFVSSGHANGSVVELRNLNPGAGGMLGAVNFNNAADTYPGQIGYTADNAMTFRAGGMTNERMRIDGTTGRVGIGTTAPGYRLDVLEGVDLVPMRVRNSLATGYSVTHYTYDASNRGHVGMANPGAPNHPGRFIVGSISTTPLVLTTGDQERVRIDAAGNVGIGTATPASALEVNGYTKLGSDAPAIRVKKLTGSTSTSEGGYVDVPHGLTASKILGVQVLIEHAPGVWMCLGYSAAANYSTSCIVSATAVRIVNDPGDSSNVLNKPVKILITYEA